MISRWIFFFSFVFHFFFIHSHSVCVFKRWSESWKCTEAATIAIAILIIVHFHRWNVSKSLWSETVSRVFVFFSLHHLNYGRICCTAAFTRFAGENGNNEIETRAINWDSVSWFQCEKWFCVPSAAEEGAESFSNRYCKFAFQDIQNSTKFKCYYADIISIFNSFLLVLFFGWEVGSKRENYRNASDTKQKCKKIKHTNTCTRSHLAQGFWANMHEFC